MIRSLAAAFILIAAIPCGLLGCQPATPGAAPSAIDPARPSPQLAASAAPPALAPSAIASDLPSLPAPPLDPRARTCPALPAARPPDLVIGVSRHVLPQGAGATVHRAELTENQTACRANLAPGTAPSYTCLPVLPTELDTLWQDFRKRSFTAMTAHGPPGSPHYGGRFLWLRWGGKYACEVGDSSGASLDRAYDKDFSELLTDVEDIGRKHL